MVYDRICSRLINFKGRQASRTPDTALLVVSVSRKARFDRVLWLAKVHLFYESCEQKICENFIHKTLPLPLMKQVSFYATSQVSFSFLVIVYIFVLFT